MNAPLLLVPQGGVTEGELDEAAAGLQSELAVVAGRLPAGELPSAAWNARRGQARAEVILFALRRTRPAGSQVIGLVPVDLYATGMSFVFGLASRRAGTAVVSVARLRDPDGERARRRIVTEVVHEAGHLLGLPHCDVPGCAMCFSNTIVETDAKGPGLCARCRAQLGPSAERAGP
jgi:archaemetzincin